MQSENNRESATALQKIILILNELPLDDRVTVITTILTFYKVPLPTAALKTEKYLPTFSEDRTISPKQFLLEKKPNTAVERVACLAYYLTHYRDTPHFKTIDISKLNTEAAQIKFSNAAMAVTDATKCGYLVPATKGQKQISAGGELFVQALPDHEAAKEAMKHTRPMRKKTKTTN